MEDWQQEYETKGRHPWDEKAGKKPLRVRLRIKEYLNTLVARHEIYTLEEMTTTQFVKTHGNGTNFRLTDQQKDAIERLIAAPRRIGDPIPDAN